MLARGSHPSRRSFRERGQGSGPDDALQRKRSRRHDRRANVVARSLEKVEEWAPHIVRNVAADQVAPDPRSSRRLNADDDQDSERAEVAANSVEVEVVATGANECLVVGGDQTYAARYTRR